MRFFVDNNLSPQLAAGMRGFGEDGIVPPSGARVQRLALD